MDPTNQRIPPPPSKRKFPIWAWGFIALFLGFVGFQVYQVASIFSIINEAKDLSNTDLIDISSYSISGGDDQYNYQFMLHNKDDQDFYGYVEMAFERTDVPLGFNQRIEVRDTLPPGQRVLIGFSVWKPPYCVDREDGLRVFQWSAFRRYKEIANGTGKLVNAMTEVAQ